MLFFLKIGDKKWNIFLQYFKDKIENIAITLNWMCFEWLKGNMSQQVKYGWCDLYSDEVVNFSDNFSFVSLLLIFADETFIAFSVTAFKIYNGIFYTLHTYFRVFWA